ncbi:basic helix-loop-helix protein [Malassezia brasiliensis]|uniref:Basic helix-loop-helix protein n=1 Tax=Malassezia brasiliensis TaxID=1821822 RepID=A0AAF0DQX2_9BASI|nr:basic helix-loop-helix protein [Malassezia brasiliensis]
MSPPTGAGQPAPSDAPHAYVDQQTTYDAGPEPGSAHNTQDNDATNAGNAQNAGIEKDVGTILAGLNQEQLASIVAAAHQYDGGEQFDSSNALAHLPHSLGQAASTLTSFASSFKRSNAPVIAPDEDLTAGGLSETGHLGDAPPPPGMEHDMSQQQHGHHTRHVGHGQQEHKGHSAAHDPAATAAALAAMGTLAGRQLQQHGQAHGLDTGRDGALGDGLDAKFVNDHSLGGARYKRKGPELDRQRKDNHKEVERRRRSAINDGIVQLSQIVPGCDVKNTNKGSIIIAAVRYIQDLKNNEASNIEKWTLEKLLMDQAMNDLSISLDESRREVERLRAQLGLAEANASSSAEKQGAAQYGEQRFQAAQPYHTEPSTTSGEQDLAVSLDQGHHDTSALDPFAHKDRTGAPLDHAGRV